MGYTASPVPAMNGGSGGGANNTNVTRAGVLLLLTPIIHKLQVMLVVAVSQLMYLPMLEVEVVEQEE